MPKVRYVGGKIDPKGALKHGLSDPMANSTFFLPTSEGSSKITTIHARLKDDKQWKSHILFYVRKSNYARFFTSLS